ncbi:MEKHLA domain-containing protein [Vibrio harveyi]|uniref:MEKHLA domain-containing protein n=1 Tax=Vibrio harveyi TaxID=669 RepID=UPI0005773C10|nr:MEKHLA domain-containing protein [Vibrio harveyi]MBY7699337.1 MEKHLA domain-containing protein [Vibrio harveyi]UIL56472.1 MEKHLA domain-containing protein [Vibrio harveyi]SQA36251.1 MEKHLA domain [Vibrio harveyi]
MCIQSISDIYIKNARIINYNFNRIFGSSLFTDETCISDIWKSNFAIISHNSESEPIFNFANENALELFEMEYEDFIRLPSEFSAEFDEIEEWNELLKQVHSNGFIKGYTGTRVSATGLRFKIIDAIIFNLYDFDYNYFGQAAVIPKWEYV